MSIEKARVVKLAKSMYGKNAIVAENPKAPDAAQRAELAAKETERRARIAALDPIIATEPQTLRALIAAARSVVENCSVGAVESLASCLKAVDAVDAARKEKRELNKQRYDSWRKRCSVSRYDGSCGIPLSIQICDGDTWEEVLAALKAEKAKTIKR